VALQSSPARSFEPLGYAVARRRSKSSPALTGLAGKHEGQPRHSPAGTLQAVHRTALHEARLAGVAPDHALSDLSIKPA